MKIQLQKFFFNDKERTIIQEDNLEASLFKFDSGIEAIRLKNEVGHIVVLPYNGQMIWDANFYGRSLKMNNSFAQPVYSEGFRHTYGCYLMHCGVLAMGCPTVEDTHAHHGEIPYADYDSASLIYDKDERGSYLAVTGDLEYNLSFGDHYLTQPLVKMYKNSGMLEVSMTVNNLSRQPMDLMYMCHVNNNLVPDSEIFQTLAWDSDHMPVRVSIPQYNEVDPSFLDLVDRIQQDVKVTNPVKKDDLYDPEVVCFLRDPNLDEAGNAHFLYVHSDGSGDYTYYDATVLNRGVRWMVYHEDWQSMGMVLPSTAEPEGYLTEKAKGNLRYIEAHGTFKATVNCGAVRPKEVAVIQEKIQKINEE